MSDRLKHSYKGYLRASQMSVRDLIVFVEGPLDRALYSRVLRIGNGPNHVEIRLARELPGATGGKQKCLEFYDYLRRKKQLSSNLDGKKTSVCFFLDKDVDDFLRVKRRSQHVVYTETYDAEGYLIRESDLAAAGSLAAELTASLVRSAIADDREWISSVAGLWREWVVLCVASRVIRVPSEIGYSVPSRIQSHILGPTDPKLFASAKARLRKLSGMDASSFKRLLDRAEAYVASRYAAAAHAEVFKGKWLVTLLGAQLRALGSANPPYHANVEPLLPKLLIAHLNVSGVWTARFVDAVESLG